MTENTWNTGYFGDKTPPINETEKAELTTIATDDTYLKGKRYERGTYGCLEKDTGY